MEQSEDGAIRRTRQIPVDHLGRREEDVGRRGTHGFACERHVTWLGGGTAVKTFEYLNTSRSLLFRPYRSTATNPADQERRDPATSAMFRPSETIRGSSVAVGRTPEECADPECATVVACEHLPESLCVRHSLG
jgi:hypothetical protein